MTHATRVFLQSFCGGFCILALTVICLAGGIRQADAEPPLPSFLQTLEIRSTDLSQFTKWTSALARSQREAARIANAACDRQTVEVCSYDEWQRFLGGLRGKSKWKQLTAVNDYMNARPYVSDDRNWGTKDYWETPGEFLIRSGDCEDFAIVKYHSLKQLGWTDKELRIAAVKDLELGVGHAVLVVKFDGKTWVLDNQLDDVTDIETLGHYQPVYSINETSWWLHQSLRTKA